MNDENIEQLSLGLVFENQINKVCELKRGGNH